MKDFSEFLREVGTYFRLKLLGSIKLVFPLALAPILWGLLAFNGVLKSSEIRKEAVVPLVKTSLTIVELRFLGTFLLSSGATLAILLILRWRHKLGLRPFPFALKQYFRYNWATFLRTVLFGGVLALPAFFVAFDFIGVVLTNLIAGLCPVFELVFDWLRRNPFVERKLRFLFGKAEIPFEIMGGRIIEVSLVIFTLGLLLLLAFDSVNPDNWVQQLRMVNPGLDLKVGGTLAITSAIFWMLYLAATSRWPAFESRNRDVASFTLVQHFALSANLGDTKVSELQKSFSLLESLLVKLAFVQGSAFLINLVWIITVAGAACVVPSLKSVSVVGALAAHASNAASDLASVWGRFLHLDLIRWATFAMIILGPSFGAYLLIGYFTQNYEESRKRLRLTIPSSTWNNLFSFLEPLGATFIGIYLLQFLLPVEDCDSQYFKYVNHVFPVVMVAYFIIFVVKFLGLYADTMRRDLAAYVQKLEKVYDDVLKWDPTAGQRYREYRPSNLPSGLKETDFAEIQSCAERGTIDEGDALKEKFFVFKTNLREQGLASLSITHKWPLYGRFATAAETKCQACHLLNLSEQTEDVQAACRDFIAANFDLGRDDVLNKFNTSLLHFHDYAHTFPLATFEWREVEKGIYLYLTGSIWFKLKRVELWAVAASARHPNWDVFQQEFDRASRGFFILDRAGVDWTAFQRTLQGSSESWRHALRDICPHLLDTDHMVRRRKSDLIGRPLRSNRSDLPQYTVRMEAADKLILLVVPKPQTKGPILRHIRFSNPLWTSPSLDDPKYPTELFTALTDFLNDFGKPESRGQFKRSILSNLYVLNHERVEGLLETKGADIVKQDPARHP